MLSHTRYRLHRVLTPSSGDPWSKPVEWFILGTIFVSVISVIFESVDRIQHQASHLFEVVEWITLTIFTIEYILRLWTCVEDPRWQHPVWGRIRYIFTLMALIDLFAILPSLLPFVGVDLRSLRVLRLARLLRIMKVARYADAMDRVRDVVWSKREELFASLAVILLMIVFSSSLIYAVEHDYQPEKFSSIPDTMWWAVTTMSTVGYGDMYPVTTLGRILASIIAVLGVGIFAVPSGILAAGFTERNSSDQKEGTEKARCPHCGKQLKDSTQIKNSTHT